jgi:hypothetical protein
VMRHAKIEPIHAAALVSIGSSVVYLPLYLVVHGTHLSDLSLIEFGLHALFQGVLVTIVSLLLYGRAVALLGALGGSSFRRLGASAVGRYWPFRCLASGRPLLIGSPSCLFRVASISQVVEQSWSAPPIKCNPSRGNGPTNRYPDRY